ncbi:hypothetical protein M8756_05685 [Lutimaribacter sp. EGI FJ00015]|uniref:Uncharacterized protein n=1 Tax=Lutimaribacter degradans TaxID=2945989 RepID=A0ACC5ZU75_9RHOB|nr:hypothetical protein [Lutimaribacter sp. EGI FJ00013]MCM2561498.1 hypothetical protein [Lutimaribacter sp. EGI FJ00013]MCO0612791.1 hypothetical protein [Lutimaribacter sp. EGI FJ00015]MCO0635449.1 hypothetical protein [Lutimaribacter sp. EGI FJ00014]
MKQAAHAVILATFLLPLLPVAAAQAGPIDRACNASPRKQKSISLCACIQRVADASLTRREQRQAARFFSDPHRAQETRQSDRPGDELFWKRYRAFGDLAERTCR